MPKTTPLFIIGAIIVILMVTISFFLTHNISFAVGDSMNPTFRGCTLIVINPSFAPESLKKGDIAIVKIPKEAGVEEISHRVVENIAHQQKFSLRGDNDSYYDFPSSIDGYFSYAEFRGKAESYYNLPLAVCKLYGGE